MLVRIGVSMSSVSGMVKVASASRSISVSPALIRAMTFPPHVEGIRRGLEEAIGQGLDLAGPVEDVRNLLGQPAQRLDELPALQDAQVAQPGQSERHQRERGDL